VKATLFFAYTCFAAVALLALPEPVSPANGFHLLDDMARLRLAQGTRRQRVVVAQPCPGLGHRAYACERFASTLAWACWPSRHNVLRPRSSHDESAAMKPARFRALLAELLADESLAQPSG